MAVVLGRDGAPLPTGSGYAFEHMFPTLTTAQTERFAAVGRQRSVEAGDVLIDAGDELVAFFVVLTGRLEIVRLFGGIEESVADLGPGTFTGEASMLSGRRGLVRIRAGERSDVVELERDRMLTLVRTDAELGDVLIRAFLLRRLELVARGLGDVVLVGSNHCSGTLRVREFLTRNGHPYAFVDLDRDAGVQALLDGFHVTEADVPVVICRGETVLKDPTNLEIAECLGLNEPLDPVPLRDMVIIGAGPAGLAAALVAASEGLDVVVVEAGAPGGQAGASSKIENFFGFPTGISGQELTSRAHNQAQKFGAHIVVAKGVKRLSCARRAFGVELEDGSGLTARTVVIATGARYRKPAVEDLSRFEGAGVYYAATFIESQTCQGDDVIVVGGGNSAGQAAVFLSQVARRVVLVIRSTGLAESMSRYLIRRIELSPKIELRARTEVVGMAGGAHLERVTLRDVRASTEASLDVRHVFVMMGAVPSTEWLEGCVLLDAKGFIKTGAELTAEDLTLAGWPLARAPHAVETSRPGIFAVGDVRSGNVKRVASAVGEGSIAVAFAHQTLRE